MLRYTCTNTAVAARSSLTTSVAFKLQVKMSTITKVVSRSQKKSFFDLLRMTTSPDQRPRQLQEILNEQSNLRMKVTATL